MSVQVVHTEGVGVSIYTSKNTTVLETFDQGMNKRMLLFHECGNGRHEYVIGSYFSENGTAFDGVVSYEWDWGHYFTDVVSAVDYWKSEVLDK